MLSDIGAEPLPQLFGGIVAVGRGKARVPIRLRCSLASVAPFAFEDIGALSAAVTAEIAVHAVLVIDVLSVLVRVFRSVRNVWIKID